MVVERKMQPLPPPEHRRVFRFVIFLALTLLAFSCWALVNSRINNAILIADDNKTPLLAGDDDDRQHNNGGDHPTTVPAAVPVSAVRMSGPMIRETPLAGEESEGSCDAESAQLRVYVYDLPPEFHFGMLGWDGKTAWPDVGDARAVPHYPGGLNLQHSVAYWLTLDILSSTLPHNRSRPCIAVRVTNASLADVFFVPFFASLSYNRHSGLRGRDRVSRNRILQAELVKYLMRQEEWRRWGGKNHLVVPHHPNSMMQARKKLSAAMYVLSDFGRYPPDVANLKKDIIAPYRHVVPTLGDHDSPAFQQRPLLAYFQGAIHRKDVSGTTFSSLCPALLLRQRPAERDQTRHQGHGVLQVLPQHRRGHSLLEPPLRCHRQPLRPRHNQRRHRAPFRGRPRLLRVLRLRPCLRCSEEWLPAARAPRHNSGPMDHHVEKAQRGGSSL